MATFPIPEPPSLDSHPRLAPTHPMAVPFPQVDGRGEALTAAPRSRSLPVAPMVSSHPSASIPTEAPRPSRLSAESVVQTLADLGVEHAFGVSGGGIGHIYDALCRSSIELHHFQHEAGAAFAATEANLASGKPAVVFATTGPGLLNTLTGLVAARWDGAKVVLLSGATSAHLRGRWPTQETSPYSLPQDALFGDGKIFDFATCVADVAELPGVFRRLAAGLEGPGGFVAHVSLPLSIQAADGPGSLPRLETPGGAATVPEATVSHCARLLRRGGFAVWVGFGAREAADEVRSLIERTGAPVISSPRGKGIVPEDHPQFVGVSGLGGHESVGEFMRRYRPRWLLVLGSRLGEATSFWDADMLPEEGFVHVDLDSRVPGTAFPEARTVAVVGDVGQFASALVRHFPPRRNPRRSRVPNECRPLCETVPLTLAGGPVRPQELMAAVQRQVIDRSDALVMSDCGYAFVWCSHYLRFAEAGRYRLNTQLGAMGHFAAGVVGAALARRGKAVALVGDGSMLMGAELQAAVAADAPAVWVVLNDGGYGICRDGHEALGFAGDGLGFQSVDFAAIARAVGAEGLRVEDESSLDVALEIALEAAGPFVVDVVVDREQKPPLAGRFRNLAKQADSQ